MNDKMLNDLLDLTEKVADTISGKVIAIVNELDSLSIEKAEAAQAAYEFLAAAKEQGLTNADLSEFEWAKVAVEAFAARRENLEQRRATLFSLEYGNVRWNLYRAINPGVVRESDPEFERLLNEDYEAEMLAAEQKAQRDRTLAEARAAAEERDARIEAQKRAAGEVW